MTYLHAYGVSISEETNAGGQNKGETKAKLMKTLGVQEILWATVTSGHRGFVCQRY